MFESVVADVLSRVLGQYVSGIDRESLKVGVWGGNLELRGLQLHAEALEVLFESLGFNLPVTVRQGVVGVLKVQVPWTSLRSKPVQVTLEDISVLARPAADSSPEALLERHARLKQARLDQDDAFREGAWQAAQELSDAGEKAKSKSAGYFSLGTSGLVSKILDNIRIEVHNIFIRYEDPCSVPSKPVCAEIQLARLETHSTDANWQNVFIQDQESPQVFKRIVLKDLALQAFPLLHQGGDSSDPLVQMSPAQASNVDPATMAKMIWQRRRGNSRDQSYILQPVSGELRAAVFREEAYQNYLNGLRSADQIAQAKPKSSLDVCFPKFGVSFDDFQYASLLSVVHHMSSFKSSGIPFQYRSAREKWQWAVHQLLPGFLDRRRQETRLTPEHLHDFRATFEKYETVRVSYIEAKRSSNEKLADSFRASMKGYEVALSYVEVIAWRDLVDMSLVRRLAKPEKKASAMPSLDEKYLIDYTEEESTDEAEEHTPARVSARFGTARGLKVNFGLRVGSITLARGGYPHAGTEFSKLMFHHLNFGLETCHDGSYSMGMSLGKLECWDSRNNVMALHPRDSFDFSNFKNVDQMYLGLPQSVEQILESVCEHTDRPKDNVLDNKLAVGGGLTGTIRSAFGNLTGSQADRDMPCIAGLSLKRRFLPGKKGSNDAPSFSDELIFALSGVDIVFDGAESVVFKSFSFWSPTSEPRRIISFLSSVADARLAELRVRMEHALAESSSKLKVQLKVRAPRFILTGRRTQDPAIILDSGTLSFETLPGGSGPPEGAMSFLDPERATLIRYTKHVLRASNLSVSVVHERRHLKEAKILLEPIECDLVIHGLQNLHLVAAAVPEERIRSSLVKTFLIGRLPSLSVQLSRLNYQHVVGVFSAWASQSAAAARSATSSDEPSAQEDHSFEDEWPIPEREGAADSSIPPRKIGGAEGSVGADSVPLRRTLRPEQSLISLKTRFDFDGLAYKLLEKDDRVFLSGQAKRSHLEILLKSEGPSMAFASSGFEMNEHVNGEMRNRLVYAGPSRPSEDDNSTADLTPSEDTRFLAVEFSRKRQTGVDSQDLVANFDVLRVNINFETYLEILRFFFVSGTKEKTKDAFYAIGINSAADAAKILKENAGDVLDLSAEVIQGLGIVRISTSLKELGVYVGSRKFGGLCSLQLENARTFFERRTDGSLSSRGQLGKLVLLDLSAKSGTFRRVLSYERSSTGNEAQHDLAAARVGDIDKCQDGYIVSIPAASEKQDPWLILKFEGLRGALVTQFLRNVQNYVSAFGRKMQDIVDSDPGGHSRKANGFEKPASALTMASLLDSGEPHSLAFLLQKRSPRLRFSFLVGDVDYILPRDSASFHEGLRFRITRIRISNEELSAVGYRFGFKMALEGINAFALYHPGSEPVPIDPDADATGMRTLLENFHMVVKGDMFRAHVPDESMDSQRVSETSSLEFVYNVPSALPALRLRCFTSSSVLLRMNEAEYSILYFVLTENAAEPASLNFDESHDVGTTDQASGSRKKSEAKTNGNEASTLKSGLASNDDQTAPPALLVLLHVSQLKSVIAQGSSTDARDQLIETSLSSIAGRASVEWTGRFKFELQGRLDYVKDACLRGPDYGIPHAPVELMEASLGSENSQEWEQEPNVQVTYDRGLDMRPVILLFVNGLRMRVAPEIFARLGQLTIPGWPYLPTSKFAVDPPFFGREMTVTLSQPKIELRADAFENDPRALVIGGDFVAKIIWAPVTRDKTVSILTPSLNMSLSALASESLAIPVVYPAQTTMTIELAPTFMRVNIFAENFVARVAVQDVQIIAAIVDRLVRGALLASEASSRARVGISPAVLAMTAGQVRETDVSAIIASFRCVVTDENEASNSYVPVLEFRLRDSVVRSNAPIVTNVESEMSLDLFDRMRGYWVPGIETFRLRLAVNEGSEGAKAIGVRTDDRMDINLTPSTLTGLAQVLKAVQSAIDSVGEGPSQAAGADAEDVQRRRPSVAAYVVRNESGRSLIFQEPASSAERVIANGAQYEVDIAAEDVLLSSETTMAQKQRKDLMQCTVKFHGFLEVSLSLEHSRIACVAFPPDPLEIQALCSKSKNASSQLVTQEMQEVLMVWEVRMEDGVAVGIIRSLARVVNSTAVPIEISDGDTCVVMAPGGHWSVPVYSVNRPLLVRPCIKESVVSLRRLSSIEPADDDSSDFGEIESVFSFSQPLAKIENLREYAWNQITSDSRGSGSQDAAGDGRPLPECDLKIVCRAVQSSEKEFHLSLKPKIDSGTVRELLSRAWVDIHLIPPLVVENALPRPLFFKMFMTQMGPRRSKEFILVDQGVADSAGVYEVFVLNQRDLSDILLEVDFANNDTLDYESVALGKSPQFEEVRPFSLRDSMGYFWCRNSQKPGSAVPLKFERESSCNHQRVVIFADVWLRNRTSKPLLVRSKLPVSLRSTSSTLNYHSKSRYTLALEGRPPGEKPESFAVCTGSLLEFHDIFDNSGQRVSIGNDSGWSANVDVQEVDKYDSVSTTFSYLTLDCRTGRRPFHRTTVVCIRHQLWVENKTSRYIQWCEPAALDNRGILLASHVHHLEPGKRAAVSWDFRKSSAGRSDEDERGLCFRIADSINPASSDWIWSQAIPVEKTLGEVPAKMYRPKTHEQYIARVVSTRLEGGSLLIQVYGEDLDHPPYRIRNYCKTRAIAFRQMTSNKAHPWLLKPGMTTRYAWDDIQAPKRKQLLMIRAIETRRKEVTPGLFRNVEVSSPEFELCIDVVMAVQYDRFGGSDLPLFVRVEMNGPSRIVTFFDDDVHLAALEASSKAAAVLPASRRKISSDIEPKPVPIVAWDDVLSGENAAEGGDTELSLVAADEGTKSVSDDAAEISATTAPSAHQLEVIRDEIVSMDIEVVISAIGISCTNADLDEVCYISLRDIRFHMDESDERRLIITEVGDFQIDNQLKNPSYPVVLWFPRNDSSKDSTAGTRPPAMQLTLDRVKNTKDEIVRVSAFYVAFQQFRVCLEETFALKLYAMTVQMSLGSVDEREPLDDDEESKGFVKSHKTRAISEDDLPPRICIDRLLLAPVKFSLSFSASQNVQLPMRKYRTLIRTLIAVLGNVENAEFELNALELENVFDNVDHFRNLIGKFYLQQVNQNKYQVVASNALLGNASGLFESVSIGARDFFVEPRKAKGSVEFITSVGRGGASLISNTAGGLIGSVGGIPRAMAQGLESAIGDKKYIAEREAMRYNQHRGSQTLATGLLAGTIALGHGIRSGATGLFTNPVEGARQDGFLGFWKGLGKGVAGVALKPLTGALDMIAEPAVGIRNMIVTQRLTDIAEPLRPPRIARGNRLRPYDFRDSLGDAILNAAGRSESNRVGYEAHSIQDRETVLFWLELTSASSSSSRAEETWLIVRRFTRADPLLRRKLKNNEVNVKRAEKSRVALVTTLRLVVATLDGDLVWSCPLENISNTHVSAENKDYLMLGVRNASSPSTSWQRLFCGSQKARDELQQAIRYASESKKSLIPSSGASASSILLGALEIEDFPRDGEEGIGAADGVSLSPSSRNESGLLAHVNVQNQPSAAELLASLDPGIDAIIASHHGWFDHERTCVFHIANDLPETLIVSELVLHSGRWAEAPLERLLAHHKMVFVAQGADSIVSDVRGSFILKTASQRKVVLFFAASMLAEPLLLIRNASPDTFVYQELQARGPCVRMKVVVTDRVLADADKPPTVRKGSSSLSRVNPDTGNRAGFSREPGTRQGRSNEDEKSGDVGQVAQYREIPLKKAGTREKIMSWASGIKRGRSQPLKGSSEHRELQAGSASGVPVAPIVAEKDFEDEVAQLLELGFDEHRARMALFRTDGDVIKAVDMLISGV
ncbi:putative vacuolar protein sorting-associated protein 13A [Porphyridium purpureum]|uniref:Putative vacuolar protein sorting-associated protein 13A n=1 Tax=Porphyridium purpureum TaxID=35688 RepID=A0A5J4YUV5_PORPP|nr:putative vacuolar protein sorting-associated protein 13A [Porphyridium purpureum]|eukprot:POR1633..scf227_4